MDEKAETCKICGAICHRDPRTAVQACVFCGFEHHNISDTPDTKYNPKGLQIGDYIKLFAEFDQLTPSRVIHAEGIPPDQFSKLQQLGDPKFKEFDNCEGPVYVIISENMLPFAPDVNDYFSDRFGRLIKGGLLFLSTPVRRPFRNPKPLEGQVNFFRSKNIMFLLEQHGFKMAWRQSRFSTTLRIIAQKN